MHAGHWWQMNFPQFLKAKEHAPLNINQQMCFLKTPGEDQCYQWKKYRLGRLFQTFDSLRKSYFAGIYMPLAKSTNIFYSIF